MTRRGRYPFSLMAVTLVFVAIGAMRVLSVPGCCDFIRACGFPAALFIEGGFAGIKKFIPSGLIVDLVILIALAGAVSLAWSKFSERTPPAESVRLPRV